MTKKSQRSVRARRMEHRARQRRQRFLTIGLVIVGVIIIAGIVAWVRVTNSSTENVELPETLAEPANADGTAWGPPDARVLIEEYSDFQ